MKKIAAFASIALFAWGSAAHAHGGTRQKVVESVEINASPDAVWNIVKEFGNAHWLVAVDKITPTGGNDVGAVRELTLKAGEIGKDLKAGVLKEELKEADAASKTIKYRVHDEPACDVFPANNYSNTVKVQASGTGTKVEWTSAAYRCFTPNNPPVGQDEKAAVETMTHFSKESLAKLKALAEKK